MVQYTHPSYVLDGYTGLIALFVGFRCAQTVTYLMASSVPSRSTPPHNILTSIFQRTQTNTMETIVNAKHLKST